MGRLSAPRPALRPAPPATRVRTERAPAHERGYTRRWAKVSKAYIDAHPLCLGCQAVDRIEATTLTDHVIPHRGNERLFWDPANRQPACRWHHDVIKQALERRFDAGEIGAADLRLDSAVAIAATRAAMARRTTPRGPVESLQP